VLPVVGRTQERENDYDFTVPYLSMHGAVFTRENDTQIKKESHLAGKELVVMDGDNAHEYLLSTKVTKNIITFTSYEEGFNALSSGKYDALIIQKLVGIQLKKNLNIKNIKVSKFILSDFQQNFTFAVKDGDKELLSLLNEGLSIVVANGTYTKLYEKWFYNFDLENNNYEVIIEILIVILLITLISIIFIYSWNRFLQTKVHEKTKALDLVNRNLENRVEDALNILNNEKILKIL
jgi:ABC-type amino acid transport substrate-binding protein